MPCNVCEGTPGLYPVMTSSGRHLYDIECPECMGSGMSEAEFEAERQAKKDRAKYEAAMAECKASSPTNQGGAASVASPGKGGR